jgi:hypothetical protein
MTTSYGVEPVHGRRQPRAGGSEPFDHSFATPRSWPQPSSLGASVLNSSLLDTPLQLDVLPGRLTGEVLVEAQVELVLLRHLREPSIGCLVLGEGNEDDQVRVQSLMAGQLHERTRDLGPDLPFPVLHELLELRLLAWLEGGMGNRSEH